MLFGPVVPDRMDPHDAAVDSELDGVGDDADLGRCWIVGFLARRELPFLAGRLLVFDLGSDWRFG
jgi:hypothetical protein